MRRRAITALTIKLTLAIPATAAAHAQLESTIPARGATAKTAPALVVFRFDEAVEGNFGAVRVFDARGARADEGDAFHPGGDGPKLGVHLKPGLADGTYTATYRVVSADGHVVSGGFTFNIGKAGSAPGKTVGELLAGQSVGAATDVAFGAARAIQFGAIAIAAGLVAFLLLVWLPIENARGPASGGGYDPVAPPRVTPPPAPLAALVAPRARRVLLSCALAGAVSALAGVALEAANAAGISGWSALRPHIIKEILGTHFGTTWTAAAAAWLVVGIVATGLLGGSGRRAALAALAVPLGFLLALPALSGHGLTQSPKGVLFPANVLHVAAMSAWLGGLVALLLVVPAATRAVSDGERGKLLSAVLARFSPIALAGVGTLLVTGLLQSYIEIRHLDLIFSTPFGRAAFIKLGLLGALIVLGYVNRNRTLPRLKALAERGATPGEAGVLLRRTLRAEVGLIVVVLGVTGALASYAPSIAQVSGPQSGTVEIGPQQLQYTVDPARVGANQIHLYLEDPRSGAQYTGAKELTAAATEQQKSIGPLDLAPQKSGPGHYTITGALLSVPGTWRLAVTMRVSEFDEFTANIEVKIR